MNRLLCISILGDPAVADRNVFADLPEGCADWNWVRAKLDQVQLGDKVEIDGIDVSLGQALPSPDDYDGVVVGGSYHNANEGHDWQLRAIDWLHEWRDTKRPFFGICGGHQMAAVALGGAVDPMGGEPFAETAPIELTDEGRDHFLFDGLLPTPTVHFGCYDHVTRMPEGATLLATYRGIVAATDLGGNWFSTQFHPEASARGMAVGWTGIEPSNGVRYDESSDGARILGNFLRGTGLV